MLHMPDDPQSYLEGRLMGLNELVSILREASEDEKNLSGNVLVKTLIQHIASEMDEIISEMKEEHGEHPLLKKAEKAQAAMEKDALKTEKKQPEEAGEALKKHVETADELMKNLLELRKQTAEE